MLHLDKTDYDLNTLFSFEILKEILLKLAVSQDKIEKELHIMKNSNIKRDKIISKIAKSMNESLEFSENDLNDDINNDENLEQNNNEENDEKTYKGGNKDEFEKKEYIKSQENNLNITNINIPQNSEKNEINDINYLSSHRSKNDSKSQKSGINVSPELFSKMMKQLNDHHKRISSLETNLKSESKNLNNLQVQFEEHLSNNESQFKIINDKIDELFEKTKDFEKKYEDLSVKMTDIDIFSMFKDNGDGTIDATKVMVRALEDKVFKKFEFVDKRYKIDSLDHLKTKTNVENIMPKIDQIYREIERINKMGNQNQEELDNYKKENDESNNEIKNNFSKDIRKKVNELREELEKLINNKISLIENKINDVKKVENNGDNFDILKIGAANNEINEEIINSIEKKISDLRRKINDLDNTLKIHLNQKETDLIRNEIKDMKLILDNKITKDDLKELYNFHLNNKDELNDLKDMEEKTYDDTRKIIKDLSNLQQKIESLNGNLALLQNSPRSGGVPLVDFSKYIDQKKLSEAFKPFFKEFEKIYREIDSVRRDMSLIDDESKDNKKNITKINDELNNKIEEFKIYAQSKYLEKKEFNKKLKSLEIQIKYIEEENKKEMDSWLLAKKPMKCFNCATCEADLKDDYTSAEYLPWKKYPRGDKIHRIGQGFSHMLQMMTSEFIKSIEKNEFPSEFEANSKNNNNNNLNNQMNDSLGIGIITNNKEQVKEDNIINLKQISKMKLPKVKQYTNNKIKLKKFDDNVPVSDDENNNLENESEIKVKIGSPKIMKITKKEKSSNDFLGNSLLIKGTSSNKRNMEFASNNTFINTYRNTFDGVGSKFPKN